MHTHILKNYLNFNYGRSYDSHAILKEKYTQSHVRRKGGKDKMDTESIQFSLTIILISMISDSRMV